MTWVPLHVHSQYSILDAAAPIDEIAARASELNLPACALTDHNNLFGAVDFYKACKEVKVKPLIGVEIDVAPTSRFEKKKEAGLRPSYHLTLIAKNKQGYHNLCKLSSLAYLEGFYYTPRIDNDLLKQHSEGLICLSGCLNSKVAAEALYGSREKVIEIIRWHQALFGEDYYLELMRHPMSAEDLHNDDMTQEAWLLQKYRDYIARQEKVNHLLIELSAEFNIPLVATNDSHYMNREDWRAHEILLNVQSGEPCEIWEKDSFGNPKNRISNPKRETYPSHEFYFKSPEQIGELFKDLPEALQNTLVIADKCHLEIDLKTRHYPVYIPPALQGRSFTKEEQPKAVESFLWELCETGIPKRYTPERLAKIKELFPDKEPLTVVKERLSYEMNVIVPKGMSDYLLIVWDFINWAKENGIPMGPGRGSGAGSIVLYLIGVTDIEPLRFHLFFERFINPERISYPDIDVDICMDRRGDVIRYTLEKYGKDNIAQIITFGTMKARMAIKDVGRVLSVPLSKVNEIAKLVPEDLNITLEKALEKDPELRSFYEADEDARRIIDLGKKLEGSIRNTGIHAAGLIVSGEPLTDHIPICLAKDSDMAATQYSMKPVEAVGMLKIDFLGLKTLTSIQIACDAVKRNTNKEIDWVNLPLDDPRAFHVLHQGRTLGVFQMESGGMQDLGRQLMPDKFEEIIAIGALYRPGPMDMIPSFINRKHGREPIEYDHPWLVPILEETYGIMVYQEQVMQIAQKLAQYSLGEGDVLRRAMGKKDHAQMEQEREKFRRGAVSNGISEEVATEIFDKIEKFASYGFNKSHAAAYGFLTYVTAYLKAIYPREWMAALMTCDRDDVTKVAKFIRECQAMGIPILPPDINEAGKEFVATEKGIRFAMNGIKGVGEGAVEAILEERKSRGPFTDFYAFFKRIDLSRVGKKAIECLVDAGSFDFTGWHRDALKLSIEEMYETASKDQKEALSGVLTLFSLMGAESSTRFKNPPQIVKPTLKSDILKKEKELLGFFLTGHPMDAYRNILQRLSCVPLCEAENFEHNGVLRSAFIIETVQTRISQKTQKKFAILNISDGMETYELPIWADLYEEKSHLLIENQLIYAVLQIDKREENLRLSCRWLEDLTKVNESVIEACDKVFDRVKMQAGRFNSQPKQAPMQEKEKSKQVPQKFEVKLDLRLTRHTHILKLKELLQAHPGASSAHMEFYADGKCMGTLRLSGGVTPSSTLQTALQHIPCLIK